MNKKLKRISSAVLASLIIVSSGGVAVLAKTPSVSFKTVSSTVTAFTSPANTITAPTQDNFSTFGNQLSGPAKIIYQKMSAEKDNAIKNKTPIRITFDSFTVPTDKAQAEWKKYSSNLSNAFSSALAAFDRDFPEVFWLSKTQSSKIGASQTTSFSNKTTTYSPYIEFTLAYSSDYSSKAEIEKDETAVNKKLQTIMDKAKKAQNNYDKLKIFHDTLIHENRYNSIVANGKMPNSTKPWTIISALFSNNNGPTGPVCEGYSRAFKLMCDKAGIPCILVSGKGTNNSKSEAHMWNYVKLNGNWYAVDVTWDDPLVISPDGKVTDSEGSLNYFLRGKSFTKNHIPDGHFNNSSVEFSYPPLSDTNYTVPVSTEVTVQNPPKSVKLGSDIKIPENCVLRVKQGEKVTDVPVTSEMLSGYNKNATGEDSIGMRTITVTDKDGNKATFSLKIEDTVLGIEVTAPKNTPHYTASPNAKLNLKGYKVSVINKSKIPSKQYDLTDSMVTLPKNALETPGTHYADVAFLGYVKSHAFPIIVDKAPEEKPSTTTPAPKPTATETPAPKPAATETPAPKPAATETPAPKPAATETPAPKPAATETPAPKPAATETPAPKPAKIEASNPKPIENSASDPTSAKGTLANNSSNKNIGTVSNETSKLSSKKEYTKNQDSKNAKKYSSSNNQHNPETGTAASASAVILLGSACGFMIFYTRKIKK